MARWPLEETTLAELLRTEEGDLLEHKESWPDLNGSRGKAELVKEVLALANTTRPDIPGYMIYGVRDIRHGG